MNKYLFALLLFVSTISCGGEPAGNTYVGTITLKSVATSLWGTKDSSTCENSGTVKVKIEDTSKKIIVTHDTWVSHFFYSTGEISSCKASIGSVKWEGAVTDSEFTIDFLLGDDEIGSLTGTVSDTTVSGSGFMTYTSTLDSDNSRRIQNRLTWSLTAELSSN